MHSPSGLLGLLRGLLVRQAMSAVEREGIGDALLDATKEPNAADGLAVPFDQEFRGGLDLGEPSTEVAGNGGRLIPHEDQDAVMADPILRTAPERETARIVGVVTEGGPIAAERVCDLGALIPVAGEDEAPRVVEKAE